MQNIPAAIQMRFGVPVSVKPGEGLAGQNSRGRLGGGSDVVHTTLKIGRLKYWAQNVFNAARKKQSKQPHQLRPHGRKVISRLAGIIFLLQLTEQKMASAAIRRHQHRYLRAVNNPRQILPGRRHPVLNRGNWHGFGRALSLNFQPTAQY